jgi:hypothetical protein
VSNALVTGFRTLVLWNCLEAGHHHIIALAGTGVAARTADGRVGAKD